MRRQNKTETGAFLLDNLGSTSWHNRHHGPLARLNEILIEAKLERPRVLIAGPGGVSRLMAPFLNNSAVGASSVRKTIGDLARYSDQLIRRVPAVPLASLEPMEVRAALSMPHELIVIDRSARLLRAVQRDIPDAQVHVVDLCVFAPPVQADVVIAFNVISRLGDRAAVGVDHLLSVLSDGGWMLIDDRSAKTHLAGRKGVSEIAPKTHRVDANGQSD